MASSSRPAKRLRAEGDEEPSTPVACTRSDLWYDDGNIVVQAETTQFRVFRGVLASESDIFNDMFSIPQPTSQGEVVDGCPVVRVHDSAQDWTYILRMICKRQYTSVPVAPLPFDVVAAFLRLGLKYNIESLKAEAVTRLTHEFPSSLQVFDFIALGSMIQPHSSMATDTINLVRETKHLNRILPCAFYVLAEAIHVDPQSFRKPQILDDGRQVQLSLEDQFVLSDGWFKSVKAQKEHTYPWLYQTTPLSTSCLSKSACFSARASEVFNEFAPIPIILGLSKWEAWSEDIDICDPCKAVAEKLHNAGREKFWQMLPSLFGFPEWDELLKEN